jgi:hypothetical protein
MNLDEEMEAEFLLRNNMPIDDFLGLTPTEMHYLLYDTLGDRSPVQFRDDIDDHTLDQIPLFRIVEEYLKIIQRDKQIKLTPLGALPKKVLVELYDKRFLLEEHIEYGISKLSREIDCTTIMSARLTAEIAGLVRKANGKLALTKAATKLLETNNRLELFKKFFIAFADKFRWSSNDLYPDQPVGQLGWAFSLIMLDRFGDQPQNGAFYAEKYLKAFPHFISYFHSQYSTPDQMFFNCFAVRTFERFYRWFGLVTMTHKNKFYDLDTSQIQRTELVRRIFKIEDH